MRNWKDNMHVMLLSLHQWGMVNGSIARPVQVDANAVTADETTLIEAWDPSRWSQLPNTWTMLMCIPDKRKDLYFHGLRQRWTKKYRGGVYRRRKHVRWYSTGCSCTKLLAMFVLKLRKAQYSEKPLKLRLKREREIQPNFLFNARHREVTCAIFGVVVSSKGCCLAG